MKFAALSVATLLTAAVAGCGFSSSTPGGGAGSAMKKVYTARDTGDYATYYNLLHPAQQAVVPQALFTSCLKKKGLTGTLQSVKVLDAYDSPLNAAGIPQKTAKVVTTRIDLKASTGIVHQLLTAYAVDAGGKWSWIMGQAAIAVLKAGNCPTTS